MNQREIARTRERLADYDRADATKQRDALVAAWRKHHPAAAAETSPVFHPLIKLEAWVKDSRHEPDEIWHSDVYTVTVRRGLIDHMFGSDQGIIQLGISALDGTACHDWREFQAIKNQLAGAECEAVELYPAESRLLDPSNYYSLWCFPGIRRLRIGHTEQEREVRDADIALAPQRAFAR